MQERIGYLKLETGNWKLETGNWKLETGILSRLLRDPILNPESSIQNCTPIKKIGAESML